MELEERDVKPFVCVTVFPITDASPSSFKYKTQDLFPFKICPLFGVRCFMQEAFLRGDMKLFAL